MPSEMISGTQPAKMADEIPPDQPSPGKAPQKVAARIRRRWRYSMCHQSRAWWPTISSRGSFSRAQRAVHRLADP